MDSATTAAWRHQLSMPLVSCPVSSSDRDEINTALAGNSALVDAMDENLIAKIYADLNTFITTPS